MNILLIGFLSVVIERLADRLVTNFPAVKPVLWLLTWIAGVLIALTMGLNAFVDFEVAAGITTQLVLTGLIMGAGSNVAHEIIAMFKARQ